MHAVLFPNFDGSTLVIVGQCLLEVWEESGASFRVGLQDVSLVASPFGDVPAYPINSNGPIVADNLRRRTGTIKGHELEHVF